jgi:hypothetical protein
MRLNDTGRKPASLGRIIGNKSLKIASQSNSSSASEPLSSSCSPGGGGSGDGDGGDSPAKTVASAMN